MENIKYKFEWKTIIFIAVIFAIVEYLMIFILVLFSGRGSIDPPQSSMTLLLGIFILIPIITGFLVAKKVQIEKIKQAGLSAFFSTFIFLSSVYIITKLVKKSSQLESIDSSVYDNSIIFIVGVLILSYYLGQFGAFIQTKFNKSKIMKK